MKHAYVSVDHVIKNTSTDALSTLLKKYAERNAVVLGAEPICSKMTANVRSLKR